MASNGLMTGNSDYSYTPAGWTCQVLLNTATVNLGYDVVEPDEHRAVPVAEQKAAGIAPEDTVTMADQRSGTPLADVPVEDTQEIPVVEAPVTVVSPQVDAPEHEEGGESVMVTV
jgi:hypothetical protein